MAGEPLRLRGDLVQVPEKYSPGESPICHLQRILPGSHPERGVPTGAQEPGPPGEFLILLAAGTASSGLTRSCLSLTGLPATTALAL